MTADATNCNMQNTTKATKTAVRKAIEACGGSISDVARHFDVERSTVYRWIDRWQLRPVVTAARASMREVASDVIYSRLMCEDESAAMDAAKFVMLHLRDDGNLLALSPDTMRALAVMGVDVSDAVREFEALVKQQAELAAGGA